MELHSYAKRRGSKKWTIEQKRKLVQARIEYDSWFSNKPNNSVLPWKQILSVAKLEDFNVFFVRKQWSNMVAKYKQYKELLYLTQVRLGNANTKSIDAKMLQCINDAWEFFEPIHVFMTRKTTNLHSYALIQRDSNEYDDVSEEDEGNNHGAEEIEVEDETSVAIDFKQQHKIMDNHEVEIHTKENVPKNTEFLQVSTPTSNTFSSVSKESYVMAKNFQSATALNQDSATFSVRNTDHDFYSKRSMEMHYGQQMGEQQQQLKDNYQQKQHQRKLEQQQSGYDYQQNLQEKCYGHLQKQGHRKDHEFNEDHHMNDNNIQQQQHHHLSFDDHTETQQEQQHRQQLRYTPDVDQNTQESMMIDMFNNQFPQQSQQHLGSILSTQLMDNIKTEMLSLEPSAIKKEPSVSPINMEHELTLINQENPGSRASGATEEVPSTHASKRSHTQQSERDKYYRHKRHFSRRLEKRFDALLQVVGQIVKAEYPNIDVSPLVSVVSSTATELINSDSDEQSSNNDVDDNNCNLNNSNEI
ncbi:probable serine/threonine-protein kinase cdc7 isoform X1 [Glossina fuscipes]|nr:probable serine/threonine-protein kinase cdc7 isoform X1 [Glossina fuscipes]KAI9590147.1 hypothetical protein GQX74_008315 [Glossina fuscipes]